MEELIVRQYDLKGALLNSYKSVEDASYFTRVHASEILRCLSNLSATAGGFVWKRGLYTDKCVNVLFRKYIDNTRYINTRDCDHRFNDDRSCMICGLFDFCVCGRNRGYSLHADFGRYGCVSFKSPILPESK